eukprot:5106533-Pyramimonas_sp.AAC.1
MSRELVPLDGWRLDGEWPARLGRTHQTPAEKDGGPPLKHWPGRLIHQHPYFGAAHEHPYSDRNGVSGYPLLPYTTGSQV